METKGITIVIDFDGTCVTHEYPKVGKDIGAAPVLKRLIKSGHNLILFTMRSEKTLTDAVNWFEKNGIDLYGINENPNQKTWTKSPKAYGQLYIDDAALGCPLKLDYSEDNETKFIQYVDWNKVEFTLEKMGLLKNS